MSTIAGSSTTAVPDTQAPARLASGALGLTQVLFCIVTGAAPIAAMMFNVPIVVLGGGSGVPGAFLIATVVLTVFSVGYIEMCRAVPSTGGFYTFITRGLGPVVGLGTGMLITLCYIIFSAAVMGVLGYFAAGSFNEWFGIDLPGWVYTFTGLGIATAFAFFHIELTAKVLGVALVCEVSVLAVLAVGVIVSGGADGLSLAPISPLETFSNEQAIKAFGAAASGIALFGAFWSWVGFEMAPNYAEESREPRKIAKVATYASVIGLGLFYILISWAFVMGWGINGVGDGVKGQFDGKYVSAFYPLADRFVGHGLTTMMEIFIITSSFACSMAFYNTGARYLFSLARERALPAPLGRTSKRRSPAVASLAVTGMVTVYLLGFMAYDSSTEAMFLKLGTWTPLLGVLGILAVQALCSFAIIRYFLTTARASFHPWRTLIAPLIGGIAQMGACYLLISNRAALAGDGDVLFIKILPFVPLVVFIAGMAVAVWMGMRAPERLALIGTKEHEEPVTA